jgi:hypothetical protein
MVRIVIAAAMLLSARGGYAESPGPEPIQAPDIRANIIKMLREGKGTTRYNAKEDLFAEAERQQKEKEQPLEPVEIEQHPVESVSQPVAPAPQTETALPKPAGPSVELPVKEIVIEDMDDLKKLAEELKKAKERQTGR